MMTDPTFQVHRPCFQRLPVPRFEPEHKRSPPKYLYNTILGKTVLVGEDVREDTPYTAISHSWGRTRIHQSYAHVEGIPWRVPRNTRFTLEELKFDLSALSRSQAFSTHSHVWIDLFCIPQDWEDSMWVKIMEEETQNQVETFRGADKAVIWIRQVDDWKPVEYALEFISLRMSQQLVEENLEKSSLTSQRLEDCIRMCNLYKDRMPLVSSVHETDSGNLPPLNDWFTSLWTLSEYWARPDMIFLDGTWTVLKASTKVDAPCITAGALGHLAALVSSVDLEPWSTSASAAHSLKRVLVESDIGQVEHRSRASIMLAASRRICRSARRSRRAQAIMGVSGATKWYGNGDLASTERDIVLGRYPASFLREVASLEGATFFAVIDVERTGFWSIFGSRESYPLYPELVNELQSQNTPRVTGTLFPFYSEADALGMNTPRKTLAQRLPGTTNCEHMWTRSWLVNDDGTVLMSQVVVLACIDPIGAMYDNDSNTEVTLQPLQHDNLRLFDRNSQKVGVYDYLATLSWWPYAKYAILLREGNVASGSLAFGILLLQLPQQQGKRRCFGKLQHFWCQAESTIGIATQDVEWEIF